MSQPQFPRYAEPIAGALLTSAPWYLWFQRIDALVSAGVTSESSAGAAIAAICTALGSPDGTPETIPASSVIGMDPIRVYGDPSQWRVALAELPDSGVGALLGITRDAHGRVSGTTDATITGTAGEITVANGDAAAGPPTLGLANLADSGVGAALVRITRDGKGRVAGTQAATTDHLTEGVTNLYFTDARARAAILSTAITDGDTTHAPNGNVVFDALAGKLGNAGGNATGDYTFDGGTLVVDSANNRVGVGSNGPQRTLHVVGPDGPVASFPTAAIGIRNILVLENNQNCNIGVVANPANTAGFFYAKSGAAAFSGSLQYSFPSDTMMFYTSGFARVSIDATGQTTPGGDNTQILGSASLRWSNVYGVNLCPGAGAAIWTSGSGTPEGAITAPVGSLYTRTDGGAGTTLYVKESGAGNTGWVAK